MSPHHNTIFISYRRSESQLHTLALCHGLHQELSGSSFFGVDAFVTPSFAPSFAHHVSAFGFLHAILRPCPFHRGFASSITQ